MITFTVYGEPVAQGRPKFTTVHGHAKAYDPAKSRDYKEYVRMSALEVKPEKPLDCPIYLTIATYRSIPKSFSKKKQVQAIAGQVRPTTKPDLDNIVKSIKDALKGVIWRDDSLVIEIHAYKFYSEIPRVEIVIREAV